MSHEIRQTKKDKHSPILLLKKKRWENIDGRLEVTKSCRRQRQEVTGNELSGSVDSDGRL